MFVGLFGCPFSLFGLSGKHIQKWMKPSRAVSGYPFLLLRCHVLKVPQCLHAAPPKRDHIWDASHNSTHGSIDSRPSQNGKCTLVSVLTIFLICVWCLKPVAQHSRCWAKKIIPSSTPAEETWQVIGQLRLIMRLCLEIKLKVFSNNIRFSDNLNENRA